MRGRVSRNDLQKMAFGLFSGAYAVTQIDAGCQVSAKFVRGKTGLYAEKGLVLLDRIRNLHLTDPGTLA